jgi:hypothetical protein
VSLDTKLAISVAVVAVMALIVRELQHHRQRRDAERARVSFGYVRYREGLDWARNNPGGISITIRPTTLPGEPDNRWEWIVDEPGQPHVAGPPPNVLHARGECSTRKKAFRKAITVAAEVKADRALRQQATVASMATTVNLGKQYD